MFFFFRTFEAVVKFCSKYDSYIPLVFMLGFFVESVIQRWWVAIENIGITDELVNSYKIFQQKIMLLYLKVYAV